MKNIFDYPKKIQDFMPWFKEQSEHYFETLEIERQLSGLQYQKGTKWRPGLSDKDLNDFQEALGFDFPEELLQFYKTVNGTDLPGVNVYSLRGTPYYYAPKHFSYPDHLATIKELINIRLEIVDLTIDKMSGRNIPYIFPIIDYHFMIIDNITNPIYYLAPAHHNHDLNQPYIYGQIYAGNLQGFLIDIVFRTHDDDDESFDKFLQPTTSKHTRNFWTTIE